MNTQFDKETIFREGGNRFAAARIFNGAPAYGCDCGVLVTESRQTHGFSKLGGARLGQQ
jgi:hypothetical protein